MTLLLQATAILPGDYVLSHDAVGNLTRTDYATVLIALAAGIAAILSFGTAGPASSPGSSSCQ